VTLPVYDQINYRVICGNHSCKIPRIAHDYDGDSSQFLPAPSPTGQITSHNIQENDSPFPIRVGGNKNYDTKMERWKEGETVWSRRRSTDMHSYTGGAQTARTKVNELL